MPKLYNQIACGASSVLLVCAVIHGAPNPILVLLALAVVLNAYAGFKL